MFGLLSNKLIVKKAGREDEEFHLYLLFPYKLKGEECVDLKRGIKMENFSLKPFDKEVPGIIYCDRALMIEQLQDDLFLLREI